MLYDVKSIKETVELKDTLSTVSETNEIKIKEPTAEIHLQGKVIIKDMETNEILQEEDNLVVLRTRLFVLQNLFKPEDWQKVESDNGYLSNNNRKVCLFKIGRGGADTQAAPFQPFVPKFSDTDLAKPIPFVVTTPDKYIDPELEANPSIYLPDKSEFSKEHRKLYHESKKSIDGSVSYYAKVFDENSMKIVFNKDSNELYAHMTLSITPTEARGYELNELGLVIAEKVFYKVDSELNRVIENGKEVFIDEIAYKKLNSSQQNSYIEGYRDCELASRVTFDTESLRSLSRGLIVEYRIYA